MRIGYIGPAEGDTERLGEAVEFLLRDVAADFIVYLGDDGTGDALADQLSRAAGGSGRENFLDAAARLALEGNASDILTALDAHDELSRLQALRILPEPPLRAIEMLDDRIVLMVHDKSVLQEEDIVNASVIVFGRARELVLKRFGARYFFSPGPLTKGKVGVIEREPDGHMTAAAFDVSGQPLWREPLQWRTSKMTVSE